jgi:hypothetical protein
MSILKLLKFLALIIAVAGLIVAIIVYGSGNGRIASFIALQSGVLGFCLTAIDILSRKLAQATVQG